ncbi:MAG TPA: ABC transporter ATP-binding protein [Sporichthya sp.]|nr:ABC transporter ATP-binding protein [Sporichthya sp.]
MATLRIDGVSRWYGNVVAVNAVTMEFGPGVTGLLGPNGAGKSTLLNMMGGFLPPSSGTVTLDGEPTWRNEAIYKRIGLVPEREAMYDVVTGWEFVLSNARLHSLPDPEAAARKAIGIVDLADAEDRPIATYSKGMRQRAKLATALVHDPSVLLLDEPFNGLDPRQRILFMDLLRGMAADGKSVIFSSHILEEVEQLAERIEVMVSGRHAASGGFREIRKLMIERPHRYTIRSADDRALASAIIAEGCTSAVELVAADPARPASSTAGLHVQATDVGSFISVLPKVATRHGIRLYEVIPADESLESVFAYLVSR